MPSGEAIDRIGWPKGGERYVRRDGDITTAIGEHQPELDDPCVIVRKVWTAPEWFSAYSIKKDSRGVVNIKRAKDFKWEVLVGVKTEALNLPADWDGSPMRCRPEVG